MNTIVYKDCYGNTQEIIARFYEYENNNTALVFIDTEDGCPYITLSTNLGMELDKNFVFIANKDNHIALRDRLVDIGYLVPLKEEAESGYLKYKLFSVTDKFFKDFKNNAPT